MAAWPRFVLAVWLCVLAMTPTSGERSFCPGSCKCVSLFSFHSWQSLDCTRGTIRDIPRRTPGRENTTTMILSWNKIQKLDQYSLQGFSSLQDLNLNNNMISDISSDAFRNTTTLTKLDLSFNEISQLHPETFQRNIKLQSLNLAHNQLYLKGGQAFLQSTSLLVLQMAQCDLTVVPRKAFNLLPELEWLDLADNFLTLLPVDAVNLLKNLQRIVLRGNPLRCDCELKKTWEWSMKPAAGKHPRQVDAKFQEPEGLRGYPWEAAGELDCTAAPQSAINATSVALYTFAAALLVILLLVVALVALVWRWRRRRRSSRRDRRVKQMLPRLPAGEYIEVLPDPRPDHIYEKVGKKTENPPLKDEQPRYVTGVMGPGPGVKLPPAEAPDTGPVYVNVKGPPLPLRPSSNGSPPRPTAPASSPPPSSPSPPPSPPPPACPLTRPCSIPLLEGCDFYEVVE